MTSSSSFARLLRLVRALPGLVVGAHRCRSCVVRAHRDACACKLREGVVSQRRMGAAGAGVTQAEEVLKVSFWRDAGSLF